MFDPPQCCATAMRRESVCEGRGTKMAEMTGWILLGLVAWLLGVAFVFVLCQMSGKEDRAAHRAERALPSLGDATITKTAH